MPDFDRQALKQALKTLNESPLALYEKLPQKEGITVSFVQRSHGGYYHGV